MRKPNLLTLLLASVAVSATGLFAAGPALASGSQVIADCNANGYLTGHHSRADLQSALNGMGADVKEYTNCYDVIRRALLASAVAGGNGGSGGSSGGSHTGSGSSGSSTPHAAPHRTVSTASTARHPASGHHPAAVSTRGVYSTLPGTGATGAGSPQSVALSGGTVRPGGAGVNAGSGLRSLPLPLVLVLVLLGLAALSGGGVAIRRRVIARDGA
ncbi:MAG TPA: hypothetical protein VNR66_06075 [Solirubrobacteraceae bacterium]|nr:hypothetical protein [Solirubrobacteraceae bacterium]